MAVAAPGHMGVPKEPNPFDEPLRPLSSRAGRKRRLHRNLAGSSGALWRFATRDTELGLELG